MAKRAKRIALIDADSILYSTASTAEMCAKGQGMSGEDLWFEVRGLGECYAEVEEKLEAKLEAVDADDAIVILSDRRNFRTDILPTYKANRIRTRRPPMLVRLREKLQARKPFPVMTVETLEADDVCGIMAGAMQRTGRDAVVVSNDKDLLTIPCTLHRNGHTFEVSQAEADRQHLYQTLIGDAVDGYTGLPGVGTKRATAILDGADEPTVSGWWRATLAAFVIKGHSQDVALTQARVARILRYEDWNPQTKEVKLWTPPAT